MNEDNLRMWLIGQGRMINQGNSNQAQPTPTETDTDTNKVVGRHTSPPSEDKSTSSAITENMILNVPQVAGSIDPPCFEKPTKTSQDTRRRNDGNILDTASSGSYSPEMKANSSVSTNFNSKMQLEKPKRALSAYNYFLREERQRILAQFNGDDDTAVMNDSPSKGSDGNDNESSDPTRPRKKARLDSSDGTQGNLSEKGREKNSRNSAKQTSGNKIGFEEIGKLIGERWKEVKKNPDLYQKYFKMAEMDKKRHDREMKLFYKKKEKILKYFAEMEENNSMKDIANANQAANHLAVTLMASNAQNKTDPVGLSGMPIILDNSRMGFMSNPNHMNHLMTLQQNLGRTDPSNVASLLSLNASYQRDILNQYFESRRIEQNLQRMLPPQMQMNLGPMNPDGRFLSNYNTFLQPQAQQQMTLGNDQLRNMNPENYHVALLQQQQQRLAGVGGGLPTPAFELDL